MVDPISPDPSSAPAADTPAPVLRAPRLLYGLTAASAALMTGLAFLWGGLDMTFAALLGSLVVGINLFGTTQFVRMVLRDRQKKALLAVSFLVKFGLTMAVIFIAIARLGMDPVGLLLGLSSVLLAGVLYAAMKPSGS